MDNIGGGAFSHLPPQESFIAVSLIVGEEDGYFIGSCPELDVKISGTTFDETQKRLDRAIKEIIKSAIRDKELSRLLIERNIPIYPRPNYHDVRIPTQGMEPGKWFASAFHPMKEELGV